MRELVYTLDEASDTMHSPGRDCLFRGGSEPLNCDYVWNDLLNIHISTSLFRPTPDTLDITLFCLDLAECF